MEKKQSFKIFVVIVIFALYQRDGAFVIMGDELNED